ncbi:alpha/beta hydrolase family protein [Microtetraspora malaysiensis]|uniref:Alpha/beta hydrolase family protein n=1 Tax=Microtetraspora malaysiensis TaxID=161358 RepID=A0ABW6SR17_9ACTN
MPLRRIALTTLLAAATTIAASPAHAAPRNVPAEDREVVFTVEGTRTYGTLHVPAHRSGQRLPAALLLPGSGPTDRNGDQPPVLTPGTLAKVAAALDEDTIITLRFDKYGSGKTGLGAHTGHPEDIDYPAFVRQAAAAYTLLLRQPETDRRAVSVIGHSEGAMTALVIADEVRPRPAGLALLQPQALRLLDLVALQLHDQIAKATEAGQFTPEQRRVIDAAVDRAIGDLRAHRPVDTTDLPAPVAQLFQSFEGVNRRFLDTDDAIYPPDVARRLHPGTRVLLTCGTNDPQVPCATTDALTEALRRAHATGPGRVVLQGIDHNLRDATHPDVLAADALAALREFTSRWRHGR